MALVLRDRLSIWALPWVFVANIGITVLTLALYHTVTHWGAIIIAWLYAYALLLQTRMMVALLLSGVVAALIVPQFASELTVELSLYMVGLLAASVAVAHGIAFLISALTGFRF